MSTGSVQTRWLPALFTLAALAIFPAPFTTARDLFAALDLSHWSNLRQAHVPGAGEQTLPETVLHMRSLLRAHGAKTFTCSGGLCASENLQQRVAEGLYPILQEAQAPYRLYSKPEGAPRGCDRLEESHDVVLYRCD